MVTGDGGERVIGALRRVVRRHVGAAATADVRGDRGRAHHDGATGQVAVAERQRAVVLQQGGAALGDRLRDGEGDRPQAFEVRSRRNVRGVRGRVEVGAVLGAFEQPGVVLLGQDREHRVVDGGLPLGGGVRGLGREVRRRGHLGGAARDRGHQLLAVRAGAGGVARLLDVVAVQQIRDPVHRAPVGGDESLEAELPAQHAVEGGVVSAGVDGVDAVVGAHHRAGTGVDRRLERLQLRLVQRLVVDGDAGRVAPVLEVVLGVVLDLGDHSLVLDALDLGRDELAGQVRVLAERLEIAPAGDEVDRVDHRREPNVLAGGPAGIAHGRTVLRRGARVPGGGQPDRCRHRRLDVPQPDAGRPVGEAQWRNAQPGHAGNAARFAVHARHR